MDSSLHLNRLCCALLLAGAGAWSAGAQSVILSKPSDVADKANSFMGDDRNKSAGDHSASSSSVFSSKPEADFDVLPGATKTKRLSAEEIKRWLKFNDDSRNWTMLTPQEILGVPSPEKIMGLPDPNQDGSRSAAERYLAREEEKQAMSATNALRQSDSLWGTDNNPFQSQKAKLDRRADPLSQNPSSRSLRGPSSQQSGADQERNTSSVWHSAFNVMAPQAKPDPEQAAAMERFRAMMEPPPAEKLPTLPGYSSAPAPAPAPKPDPYLQPMPASYNPAGRSFTPIRDNSVRPSGITPLPTITGQTPNQTAPKPKPLVDLPPWMSNDPKPGQMPQRKF